MLTSQLYSNKVSFHNFRLLVFHTGGVSCHVRSSMSSHRVCFQAWDKSSLPLEWIAKNIKVSIAMILFSSIIVLHFNFHQQDSEYFCKQPDWTHNLRYFLSVNCFKVVWQLLINASKRYPNKSGTRSLKVAYIFDIRGQLSYKLGDYIKKCFR